MMEDSWDEAFDPTPSQARRAVRCLLRYIGEDVNREGLKDTPARYVRMLDELVGQDDFNETLFSSTAGDLVVVGGIPLASFCEHHMLPYWGEAAIGYIPNTHNPRLLGLSKLVRIVRREASRLTVQEELSGKIADAVKTAARTLDIAVITNAQHSCLAVRGVRTPGTNMVASAMLGAFKSRPELRQEFLTLARR